MSSNNTAMQTAKLAAKACHNCRRDRRRCDRLDPHCGKCSVRGIQCLGYGQLYMWTGSVASRGKLAGKSSSALLYSKKDEKCNSRQQQPELGTSDQLVDLRVGHGESYIGNVENVPSTPWVIADPLYQDMSYSHRYYLSYFSSRLCVDLVANDRPDVNPFRYLLTFTKSHPLLLHVIVAASAAHLCNTTQYLSSTPSASSNSRVLKDALVAKHKALQLMPVALQNIETIGSDIVLAAALFLINVELIESGKDGWRPHLMGACQIMSLVQPTMVLDPMLRDYIFSDFFVYYILATVFSPGPTETPTYFQSSQILAALERATTNSYFCCPPQLLEILFLGSRLSDEIKGQPQPPDWALAGGTALFERAQTLEFYEWAEMVRSVSSLSNVSVESRMQAGHVHRLAACLYILHVIPPLQDQVGHEYSESLIEELFEALDSIPEADPNFKCTSWLTFIGGAAATNPQQRQWAMARLNRLKLEIPWGFINTAVDVLQQVWDLDTECESPRNWIQRLKDPKLNFLIV